TPIPARAAALNQPLIAFQTEPHTGPLGRSFNTVGLGGFSSSEGQVAIRALKKAEDSNDYVLRVQELEGRLATKYLQFPVPFQSVREINAAEESTPRTGVLKLGPNGFEISLKPYQPRTFAIRFKNDPKSRAPSNRAANVTAIPLSLPFNMDGVSADADRADGDFDGKRQTIAGELLPSQLMLD